MSKNKDKKSIVIKIDEPTHRSFKAACASKGVTQGSTIEKLMKLFGAGKIHLSDKQLFGQIDIHGNISR